ncbi:MAG: hypothetical protein CBR30_09750 [Dictyoglomus sp. NZ13-RE01]|nr:MAG: hypothetical protein CBR30_09750 [Dictyoglomus sp. NZ13-RE01]
MAVSVTEVLQKLSKEKIEPAEVGTILDAAREAAIKARQELSKKVKEFWTSDEGELVRYMLGWEAEQSGFAAEMERIMSSVREDIRKVAKATGLGNKYRYVWGKPPKPA